MMVKSILSAMAFTMALVFGTVSLSQADEKVAAPAPAPAAPAAAAPAPAAPAEGAMKAEGDKGEKKSKKGKKHGKKKGKVKKAE